MYTPHTQERRHHSLGRCDVTLDDFFPSDVVASAFFFCFNIDRKPSICAKSSPPLPLSPPFFLPLTDGVGALLLSRDTGASAGELNCMREPSSELRTCLFTCKSRAHSIHNALRSLLPATAPLSLRDGVTNTSGTSTDFRFDLSPEEVTDVDDVTRFGAAW